MEPSSCPSAERLHDLLADRLSEAEQEELSRHLEACPRCRQRLEASAGGTSWLPDSREWNPDAQPPTGDDLQRTMAGLLTAQRQGQAPAPGAADDDATAILQPASEAGFIGRFGPYDVIEIIGRGGMGIVLKARDSTLNRTVAVKVLAPQLAASPSARQRFLREARSAAAITHDHLVTIHAVDEVDGLPYLVMEYVAGQTLQERIDTAGPPDVDEIVRIGMEIASGLAAAHAKHLVHRDIKPANILLDGQTDRVKIADFGLAKAAADIGVTKTGTLAGTPQYMAPEQARGEPVDHRADLFSLGSVLYALCTGRAPFEGTTPVAVLRQLCDRPPRPILERNRRIPAWLAEIVERLLEKDPDNRFQSAAEVAFLLGQHLTHVEPTTTAERPTPAAAAEAPMRPPSGRARRRRWLVPAGAAALLVALVAAAELAGVVHLRGLFTEGRSSSPPAERKAHVPPPGAARAPAEQGFVLRGKSGAPRAFARLTDAAMAAEPGDTIDVQRDGTIQVAALQMQKPLTIRAADGCRPVFEMGVLPRPCFDVQAPLVLEGLTFHVSVPRRQPPRRRPARPRRLDLAPVVVHRAPLFVANCRFVLLAPEQPAAVACLAVIGSPLCEVRNCLFIGTGCPAVNWTSVESDSLVIHNSASTGVNAVTVRSRSPRCASLRLTRNTFCGREALFLAGGKPAPAKMLDVQASENVFEVGLLLVHTERLSGKLTDVMSWTGRRNVFALKKGFVGSRSPLGRRPGASQTLVRGLAEWNRLWGHDATGSREIPTLVGRDVGRRARSDPQRIQAQDFHFQGLDAGADVALLGPGDPYRRWRKSPAYAPWLDRTRQAKAGHRVRGP